MYFGQNWVFLYILPKNGQKRGKNRPKKLHEDYFHNLHDLKHISYHFATKKNLKKKNFQNFFFYPKTCMTEISVIGGQRLAKYDGNLRHWRPLC